MPKALDDAFPLTFYISLKNEKPSEYERGKRSVDKSTERRYPLRRLDRLPIVPFTSRSLDGGIYLFLRAWRLNDFGLAAPELRKLWTLHLLNRDYYFRAFFVCRGTALRPVGSQIRLAEKSPYRDDLWYSLSSLLNAFAWDERPFRDKILTGVASHHDGCPMTYVSECFASKRGTYQGWIMVIGLLNPFSALVARLQSLWHIRLAIDFVWGALGMFVVVFASKIQESPHWFENKATRRSGCRARSHREAVDH